MNKEKSRWIYLGLGLLIGVVVGFMVTQLSMKEMAPVDSRLLEEEGILVAQASSYPTQRFLNKSTETTPVFDRFIVDMEHKDPGILVTWY